jgi:hypothetical protein
MSEHTPGPWIPSASRVNANNDESICWIAPLVGHDVCGDREIANARLIAAAPDLLAACRAVVERWESGDLAEATRMCAAAIAKTEAREA